MAEEFGDVLKCLREAADLSLGQLAARTYLSKAALGHAETGVRRPTAELARACDRALGTAPLLAVLHDLSPGGDMRRRALLGTIGTVAGIGGVAGVHALAEAVRAGLLERCGGEDWDALVADYHRRAPIDPSPAYGAALLTSLMLASQYLRGGDSAAARAATRAAAHLAQLYGLYSGEAGDISTARGWYRAAGMLGRHSGDTHTAQWVLARTASRALYEDATVTETYRDATTALGMTSAPTDGAMEAHAALVHVHALTGHLAEGRASVGGMSEVAARLPDPDRPAGPVQRAVLFDNYLECRQGSRRDADAAHARAEPLLREVPVWHADARVYFARALVADGEVSEGVRYGLAAVRDLPGPVRSVGLGVRDLLSVVPDTIAGLEDDLRELREAAAPGPAPWERMR